MDVQTFRWKTALAFALVLAMLAGGPLFVFAAVMGRLSLACAGAACWAFYAAGIGLISDWRKIARAAYEGRVLQMPVACKSDKCPWTALRVVPDSPDWVEWAEAEPCPLCRDGVAAFRVDHRRNAGDPLEFLD